MAYIEAKLLETYAEAPEGTPTNIWQQLADAASLQFDREADVSQNFFAPAGNQPSTKYFRSDGTQHIRLLPFIGGSITAITVDSVALSLPSEDYFESDFFLVFDYEIEKNKIIAVTAKWGFTDTPPDIKQAVIEQALFLWRKKDLAFADLANVASAVANAETSQTFAGVAQKYREIYGSVVFA